MAGLYGFYAVSTVLYSFRAVRSHTVSGDL